MEMSAPIAGESLEAALRKIPTFSDLTGEQMGWLTTRLSDERCPAGALLAKQGDPADHMNILLEGTMRYQAMDGHFFLVDPGTVTGLLPYSRLTQYRGNVTSLGPVRVARLHKQHFTEMLYRIPSIGSRLVSIMADRIRNSTYQDLQHEKLAAVGKLSAGLAHELNNPAAAARQASADLRTWVQEARSASLELISKGINEEQTRCLTGLEQRALLRMSEGEPLDTVERSDREDVVAAWLKRNEIGRSWEFAPVLVDAGIDIEWLDDTASYYPQSLLSAVIRRLAAALNLDRCLGVIDVSTKHISMLVNSVKEYTYMDQAPVQEIDLHRGIENTLDILNHCIAPSVRVIREYDHTIPRIQAFGSELNQAWTNLIENALEAMEDRGTLTIRTRLEVDVALVEIIDTGKGIPEEIQSRVFEPFFSTKQVGEGTGLGLDMVYRIVQRHRGDIKFDSRPGHTCFQVRLPLSMEASKVPA
jgi:signal transduction histidine kinase